MNIELMRKIRNRMYKVPEWSHSLQGDLIDGTVTAINLYDKGEWSCKVYWLISCRSRTLRLLHALSLTGYSTHKNGRYYPSEKLISFINRIIKELEYDYSIS